VLVEPHSGKFLGGAILRIEGGEILALLRLAMREILPYYSLKHAVFADPTLAESLNNRFANLEGA
jgi:pyruvate/2-oxoglutarate dehydrogenase complex dihydrolipoamide dehydrogenase (E3) component